MLMGIIHLQEQMTVYNITQTSCIKEPYLFFNGTHFSIMKHKWGNLHFAECLKRFLNLGL